MGRNSVFIEMDFQTLGLEPSSLRNLVRELKGVSNETVLKLATKTSSNTQLRAELETISVSVDGNSSKGDEALRDLKAFYNNDFERFSSLRKAVSRRRAGFKVRLYD